MQRITSKKQVGHEEFSYRVKYVEEVPGASEVSRKLAAYRVLSEISSNPGLLDTGPRFFTTMKMYWDGTSNSWVVELDGTD